MEHSELKSSFLEEVKISFPPSIPLPEEFQKLLRWMEKDGHQFIQHYTRRDGRFASIYESTDAGYQRSCISILPAEKDFARHWLGNSAAETDERLVVFIRTGGDGSYAGIWLDDDGRQKFVHMGSGSGSTTVCVLTDNALDFLRLMAIGYEELCWPQEFSQTPYEVFEEKFDDDDDEQFSAPTKFQNWLKTEFDVQIPATAAEIVKQTAEMGDKESNDSFWLWTKKLAG